MIIEGVLQKVSAPCLRCNWEVEGFLIPDGRFICPNCDPPAVYQRWARIWDPHEKRWWAKKAREKLSHPWLAPIAGSILLAISIGCVYLFYDHFRDSLAYFGFPHAWAGAPPLLGAVFCGISGGFLLIRRRYSIRSLMLAAIIAAGVSSAANAYVMSIRASSEKRVTLVSTDKQKTTSS